MMSSSVFDIQAGDDPAEIGSAVFEKLALKGFCVIDVGLNYIDDILRDVQNIDAAGRFHRPHPVLTGGLLGKEGSAEIAELDLPDTAPDKRIDGASIRRLDDMVGYMGAVIQPWCPMLGFEITTRSPGLLHRAGLSRGDDPHMSEVEGHKWLRQFWWHRIMAILFLGPGTGVLELLPFGQETDVHEIPARASTLVFVRPDIMTHVHRARDGQLALSTFFMTNSTQPAPNRTPTTKAVLTWMLERCKELKEIEAQDELTPWDPEIPREYQRMMNHMYHAGHRTGVRSVTFRNPSTWSPQGWCCALVGGPDLVTEVPFSRWNHHGLHAMDPDSTARGQTYSKHAAFIDGLDLFDNKIFQISNMEAGGMDPLQRCAMETGYDALLQAGCTKKALFNTNVSVYVGVSTNNEWLSAEKTVAGGTTSGAVCITANRLSYVLGLKGPSVCVDQEGASGLSAVHQARVSVAPLFSDGERKRATVCPYGVAIGTYAILSYECWHMLSAAHMLSRTGRCLVFDNGADSYSLGEGTGCVCLKAMVSIVDGIPVMNDESPPIGHLVSTGMNYSGGSAGLGTPHGPAFMQLVREALQDGHVASLDVDAVECHAEGNLMGDAIEIASYLSTLRDVQVEQGSDEILGLGALKSCQGHNKENAGMAALVKTLLSARLGRLAPNLHLRQINAYTNIIEHHCDPTIPSETFQFRLGASYCEVMAHGYGGSNAAALCWGSVDEGRSPHHHEERQNEEVLFWPGGGGDLEDSAIPDEGYCIVGTWSGWRSPIPMEREDDDSFGFTVTLGENCWEQFQIWLDGDPSRALHPNMPRAPKQSPVHGPDDEQYARSSAWMIDGRYGEDWDNVDWGHPGDQFRVHLYVAGRWRAVSWEKLDRVSGALDSIMPRGTYYVVGNFSDWDFIEMTPHTLQTNVFTAEVTLSSHAGGSFQIVRDQDWCQVFHPPIPNSQDTVWIVGPDDEGDDLNWHITGEVGDVVKIEFTRQWVDNEDVMTLKWSHIS